MPSVIAKGGPPPPGCGGDDDNDVLKRDSFFPGLYSSNALPSSMHGKVREQHVSCSFKRPTQDPTKVQLFDPDRARKSLGGLRTSGARPPPAAAPALLLAAPEPGEAAAEEEYQFEPLVLWSPPPPEIIEEGGEGRVADDAAPAEGVPEGGESAPAKAASPPPPPVEVDGFLCRWLRSHQREGTQFLFDCIMGLREYEGAGCILADDMGLGKTLQSIAILWTLMTQGMEGKPAVNHTIVTCPVSLVTNWESELKKKWIGEDRLKKRGSAVHRCPCPGRAAHAPTHAPRPPPAPPPQPPPFDCRRPPPARAQPRRIDVIAVAEAKKADVKSMIKRFIYGRSAILIISYETFRIHQSLFKHGNQCGLLICDEVCV